MGNKRERKRRPVDGRPDVASGPATYHKPTPIMPLPVWCQPEFNTFIDDYTAYVDTQIRTFSIMFGYADNDYTSTSLNYWKSVRKAMKHIRWAGSRNNDI